MHIGRLDDVQASALAPSRTQIVGTQPIDTITTTHAIARQQNPPVTAKFFICRFEPPSYASLARLSRRRLAVAGYGDTLLENPFAATLNDAG